MNMGTDFEQLTQWVLKLRDTPHASAEVTALVRAATGEAMVRAALENPTLRGRLVDVPEERHHNAVRALSVIAAHRHLRNSPLVPLGYAYAKLTTKSTAMTLGLAVGSTQANAVRLLGSALTQAGRASAVHLAEFVSLLTDWDNLSIRDRSQMLVDFHCANRA